MANGAAAAGFVDAGAVLAVLAGMVLVGALSRTRKKKTAPADRGGLGS